MSDTLSIILFSGTEDKLHAAATITAGAATMDRPANILLQPIHETRPRVYRRAASSVSHSPERPSGSEGSHG